MPGPISFRPTPAERAGLQRLARQRPGGKVSDVLRDLIRDRLPELANEADLIAALDESYRKLTIALTPSPTGAGLAVIDGAVPRSPDAPPVEQVAAVEAREHAGRVAVELVGRGEFEGCRVLLMIAPAGRRVRFEVVPSELTPAMPA